MVKMTHALLLVAAIMVMMIVLGFTPVFTPDQSAYRLYSKKNYSEAAEQFVDPLWRGVAHFRAGDFKTAANVFSGLSTAEGFYNHGNSLIMMGKYEAAIGRYDRALAINPDWEEAQLNREIAVQGAAYLKTEGGEMTGGKLAADDIVFGKGKTPTDSGDAEDQELQGQSDAEMRAVWLRQVQTSPADFLRTKFSYQHSRSADE